MMLMLMMIRLLLLLFVAPESEQNCFVVFIEVVVVFNDISPSANSSLFVFFFLFACVHAFVHI